MAHNLLIFGYGYTSRALSIKLVKQGWSISATTRKVAKLDLMTKDGITPLLWGDSENLLKVALSANVVLISTPPEKNLDPVISEFENLFASFGHLNWIGYLSSTSVYGNYFGSWVDEKSPLLSKTEMGQNRKKAEENWAALSKRIKVPLHIFRLSGIYGPGRNPFQRLKAGSAQNIVKEGQFFSRIHIDDIVQILSIALGRPLKNMIYNLSDELPASSSEVILEASRLLGVLPPRPINIGDLNLSDKVQSFYADTKKVNGERLLRELDYKLLHPNFRSGLKDILDRENFK